MKKKIKFLTFRGPCIVIYSCNKSQRDALILIFILVKDCVFGQIHCPLSRVLVTIAVNTVLRLLMMDSRSIRNT